MIYLCGVLIILAPFMWWLVDGLLNSWAENRGSEIGLSVCCGIACLAQIILCIAEIIHLTHNI